LIFGFLVALLAGCGDGDNSDGPALPTHGAPTPTPTHTPDNRIFVSCPVTPGETVVLNGTPFVILARPCTRTPTPIR
jgi:hypothetical protein